MYRCGKDTVERGHSLPQPGPHALRNRPAHQAHAISCLGPVRWPGPGQPRNVLFGVLSDWQQEVTPFGANIPQSFKRMVSCLAYGRGGDFPLFSWHSALIVNIAIWYLAVPTQQAWAVYSRLCKCSAPRSSKSSSQQRQSCSAVAVPCTMSLSVGDCGQWGRAQAIGSIQCT